MKWILFFSGFVWIAIFTQHVFAQNKLNSGKYDGNQKYIDLSNNDDLKKNCLKTIPNTNKVDQAKDNLDAIVATISYCLLVKQWDVIEKNLNMAEKLLRIVNLKHRDHYKILILRLWYHYYDSKAMEQKDVDFKKEKTQKAIESQMQRLIHRISDLKKASKKIAQHFAEINKKESSLKTPIEAVQEQLRMVRLSMIQNVIKLKIAQWQAQKNQLELHNHAKKAKLHPDTEYVGWYSSLDGTQEVLLRKERKQAFSSHQENQIDESKRLLQIATNISNIQVNYQVKWNELDRQRRLVSTLLWTGIAATTIGVGGVVGGGILVGSSSNLSPIPAQNFNTIGTTILAVGCVLVILGGAAVVASVVVKPQPNASDYSLIELYDKHPPQTQTSYYHFNKQDINNLNNHKNPKSKSSVHKKLPTLPTIALGTWK